MFKFYQVFAGEDGTVDQVSVSKNGTSTGASDRTLNCVRKITNEKLIFCSLQNRSQSLHLAKVTIKL